MIGSIAFGFSLLVFCDCLMEVGLATDVVLVWFGFVVAVFGCFVWYGLCCFGLGWLIW